MPDQKNNCEYRDWLKAKTKRDQWLLNAASLLGACGFAFAMSLSQTAFTHL